MVTGTTEPENEKGESVGTMNRCGEDKEERKEDHGVSCRVAVGRHFSTMAEANAYLADLSCYPSLANWLAGEAREEEARRLRRSGKKKRRGLESEVVGEGEGSGVLGTNDVLAPENGVAQINVVEGAQGSNHLQIDAVSESEDAGAQQEKVAVGAQGSAYLGTNAVLESESAVIQQHHVDDTGKGHIRNTSSFGESTEPTSDGNVLEESAAVIDLCFSCSDKGAKMNSETDDFIEIRGEGEQAENDTDLERRVSLEAQPDDRMDIIPVKLLGEQAENDACLEGMVSLEAQPANRKDIIPTKLLRAARYFDPQDSSLLTCSRCGEDDHIAVDCSAWKKKKKKKQKVCCICGRLGHHRQQCKKVNKCLFCNKKGHLAKDCPEEEIVREQTSRFCLTCANPGHDMFSCTNDYLADDLERIQCYVCKAFGHLCCTTYENEGPRSVSCYNCGESDHLGSECKKLPEKSSEPKRRRGKKKNKKLNRESSGQYQQVHPDVGEKGHLAQECNKFEKGKKVSEPMVATPSNVPKLAKLPEVKKYDPRFEPPHRFGNRPQSYVPRFNPSYRFGYGPQIYVPRFNPPHRYGCGRPMHFWHNEIINPQQSWPQWRGFNYPQQRPFFGTHRSHVWRPPTAAAEGNNISSSNFSSQSFVQPRQ